MRAISLSTAASQLDNQGPNLAWPSVEPVGSFIARMVLANLGEQADVLKSQGVRPVCRVYCGMRHHLLAKVYRCHGYRLVDVCGSELPDNFRANLLNDHGDRLSMFNMPRPWGETAAETWYPRFCFKVPDDAPEWLLELHIPLVCHCMMSVHLSVSDLVNADGRELSAQPDVKTKWRRRKNSVEELEADEYARMGSLIASALSDDDGKYDREEYAQMMNRLSAGFHKAAHVRAEQLVMKGYKFGSLR